MTWVWTHIHGWNASTEKVFILSQLKGPFCNRNISTPHKRLGIFWKPFVSWVFGNEMYYIPLQSIFFLLYNATLLVTIASCRAALLPLSGGRVRRENVLNIGSSEQSTLGLKIIWDAVLICLNGDSCDAFWVVDSRFDIFRRLFGRLCH